MTIQTGMDAVIHQAPAVPFEIKVSDGHPIGTDGNVNVIAEPAARMFKRRAIKGVGSPLARNVEWLVVELNGVRVYVDGSTREVVVTTEDLMP